MKRPDFILGLTASEASDRALVLNRAFELGITRINTPDAKDVAGFVSRFAKKSNCQVQTHFRLSPGSDSSKGSVTDIFEQACQSMGLDGLETFSFESLEDIKNNPQSLVELVEIKKKSRLQNIGVLVGTEAAILAAAKIPALQVLQVSFNLIENSLNLGTALKKALEAGKILQAVAPFMGGVLTRSAQNLPEKYQTLAPSLKKLTDLAGRSKMSMESLCLAYVLQQKIFSAVIVEAESKDQLVKNWQSYQAASRLEIRWDEIHRITQDDSKKLALSLSATI